MIKITDNGIEVIKDDIFNLLTVPDVWSNRATYTAKVTASGVNVDIECSLFRDKYVRLYKQPLGLREGTYTLTVYKDGDEVYKNFLIVKGVK